MKSEVTNVKASARIASSSFAFPPCGGLSTSRGNGPIKYARVLHLGLLPHAGDRLPQPEARRKDLAEILEFLFQNLDAFLKLMPLA